MNLRENTRLQGGKYKILRFIGSGGFGCTYEAEHIMLEKRVAVKEFFARDFCNRDDTSHVTVATQAKKPLVEKLRRKFLDEAKAMCQFHHPGIVGVFDVFEENGTAYYVMDFIEGRSLQDIVKSEGPLPEDLALKYILQVADALKYVHDHNRLHLDVKPGNIMVDGSDNAILIDFGASKQYDEANGENTSTLMGKTPGYAPPEQMANSIVKFAPTTDIYALGATFYKILTGVTPLDASMLISGEILDPIPPTISERIRRTIAASMSLNKRQRIQTIPDFLNYLGYEARVSMPDDSDVVAKVVDSGKPMDFASASDDMLFVDMGLSVKWATHNLGAHFPYEFGAYYAWGETRAKISYTKRNNVALPSGLENIPANEKYDAARNNWGDNWRLPTEKEIKELVERCVWKWVSRGSIGGYNVIGPNGNSMFLPASGWLVEKDNPSLGRCGCYWSSSSKGGKRAFGLFFLKGGVVTDYFYRYYGRSIRPVSE